MKIFVTLIFCLCYCFKSYDFWQFFTIQNTTYYISLSRENWYTAMRNCEYMGMQLVDILDKYEDERIVTLISGEGFPNDTMALYWTSGTDLGNEANFFWMTSGHLYIYSNWMDLQPDNLAGAVGGVPDLQNCMVISSKVNRFKWNDELCMSKNYYVCRDNQRYGPPLFYRDVMSAKNILEIENVIGTYTTPKLLSAWFE